MSSRLPIKSCPCPPAPLAGQQAGRPGRQGHGGTGAAVCIGMTYPLALQDPAELQTCRHDNVAFTRHGRLHDYLQAAASKQSSQEARHQDSTAQRRAWL
eukprot:365564-Pelagomonas_calceolata.AAC.1